MITTLALEHIMVQLETDIGGGTATLHLFKTDIVLTPSLQTSDFTEADYTGYSAGTVTTVGVPWDNPDGDMVLSMTSHHFQPSGSAVGNTIYGWWLAAPAMAGGPPVIVAVEKLDPPVNLNSALDALDLVAVIKLGQPVGG